MMTQNMKCDTMRIQDRDHLPEGRGIGLWGCVDVYNQTELFETIDSERVVELSRLGGQSGDVVLSR